MSTQTTDTEHPVDYEALRRRLAQEHGPTYWRSLDDLAHLEEVDEAVHREFPSSVTETLDPVTRRSFMKVMGASFMLAGLANCARQPDEELVPYVNQPEKLIPGTPQYFATAASIGGYGIGLVATAHENRPTKLEGLPEHPSSLGRTDAWAQAALLDMYDPDRLDVVRNGDAPSTWASFVAALGEAISALGNDGGGLRILSESVTSPTLARQRALLLERFPGAKWYAYEPVNRDNAVHGAQAAFKQIVEPVYDFKKARVILSLDADFMTEGPGRVRYMHDFAEARDAEQNAGQAMNRLYTAEAAPTLTGANADHRAALPYPQVETLARVVARRVGVADVPLDTAAAEKLPAEWVDAVVADLESHAGEGLVLAGDTQPPVVHHLAHAINQALRNANATVRYLPPIQAAPGPQTGPFAGELAKDMRAGNVEVLLILGGNPAFTAPVDADFAGALAAMQKKRVIHLTSHMNETARYAHWCIPETHFLEAWSDVRGHDGTASIVQPIIQPLYPHAKSAHEVVAALLGDSHSRGYSLVRATWQARWSQRFEERWKRSLSHGVAPDTADWPVRLFVNTQFAPHEPLDTQELGVVFRADPAIYDGRWINNGWLMELPRPLTKLTWSNAVLMSRDTAAKLGVKTEEVVRLAYEGQSVKGAVLVQPGHPDGSVTVHLGYGRKDTGKVGAGAGFNAYLLRTAGQPWYMTGVRIAPANETALLARTEDHYLIEQSTRAEKRHLIREAGLDEYKARPNFAAHMGHHAPGEEFTLYDPEEKKFGGHQWGMTIDLNRCVGCNACMIACQSENNIPIVGKEQIAKGREMHWIRVDRYYKAASPEDFDDPELAFQPVPCMQCENAPCEPVCPVGATMHSKEGLNDMVYNRCVGTRYCSNNCPYKVRRFNFFHWHTREGQDGKPLRLMRNPNVTVRSRGVMEKCTYCVQRINAARIEAKKENRAIRDGEVVTACQSACPAGAIVFGNINDDQSAVSKKKASPRNYGLLADIGTRPRTTYLAKLRNPSAKLAPAGGEGHSNGHGNG
ncbi:MAG: TAT-variant-translocated molybdopterin oxidoreductase [Candidatus Hydrogenedentota bacterium]